MYTVIIASGGNRVVMEALEVRAHARKSSPLDVGSVDIICANGIRWVHFRQRVDSYVGVLSSVGNELAGYSIQKHKDSKEKIITDMRAELMRITAFKEGYTAVCPKEGKPIAVAKHDIPLGGYKAISGWGPAKDLGKIWNPPERPGIKAAMALKQFLEDFDPGSILRDIGKGHYLPYV